MDENLILIADEAVSLKKKEVMPEDKIINYKAKKLRPKNKKEKRR